MTFSEAATAIQDFVDVVDLQLPAVTWRCEYDGNVVKVTPLNVYANMQFRYDGAAWTCSVSNLPVAGLSLSSLVTAAAAAGVTAATTARDARADTITKLTIV